MKLTRRTVLYEQVGGPRFAGYVAAPVGARARPGVLLGPDWSGPNDPTREIADRVAALGHPCFLLDVYGEGVRGDPRGDNSRLMAPLLANRSALRERGLLGLQTALDQPEFATERVAAIGFCFGGLVALDLARAAPEPLVAVATFHAALNRPAELPLTPISAQLLVCHGWSDPFVPPADLVAFCDEMTRAGADFQVHVHGQAMHAFTFRGVSQPARGLAYNEHAARRSWQAVTSFLARALHPDP